MKLPSLILVSVLLAATTRQDHLIQHEETQAGVNEAADKEARAAEAEMARVLETLLKKAAGKADTIAKLNKSQAAWKTYRDAQVEAMWPFPDRVRYGSVNSMCVPGERTKLTKIRVAELRAMLEPIEGDVCNSKWPE